MSQAQHHARALGAPVLGRPLRGAQDPWISQDGNPASSFPGTATASETAARRTADFPPATPQWLTVSLWVVLAGITVAAVFLGRMLVRKNHRRVSAAPAPGGAGATEPLEQEPAWEIAARQTMGKREHQEDSFCFSDPRVTHQGVFAAVADGVGGMDDGQVASSTVAKGMLARFRQAQENEPLARRLLKLVAAAHRDVLAINGAAQGKCGSTVVCALVVGDELFFASVGDSRIYLHRDGGLIQLNREHVLGPQADEQLALGLRDQADMPDSKHRKAITAYLGKEDLRLIDRNIQPIKLYPGDRVLLMSDGVFGTLSEEAITQALRGGVEVAVETIVGLVNGRQMAHQDNATILILGI